MDYYRPVFEDLAKIEKYDVLYNLVNSIEPHFPKIPQAYDLLSYGYYKAKKYKKAAAAGQAGLDLMGYLDDKNSIRFNLAKCYQYANEPEKAIKLLEDNIRTNPEDLDSFIDCSVAHYAQGKKSVAGLMLDQMLQSNLPYLTEDHKKIISFNLGVHRIREGKFLEGMKLLKTGRDLNIWGSYTHDFPIPKWDGTTIKDANILIIGEGGIGDEFINARFAEHFRQRGMIPSWASAHGLANTLKCLPFEHTINYKNFTTDIKSIHFYDYWIPAMDLPAVLELNEGDLWYGPYLKPTNTDKYEDDGILKIGIRWSGNPLYEQDLHRTIPIQDIIDSIFDTIKVPYRIYSFQKDSGTDMLHYFPEIVDLEDELKTFDDTLHHLNNMDLVISSCTSVAHASAALGKDTFIFTPIMAYYTWGNDKVKSPWYGEETKILHQKKPKSWDEPIKELENYLALYNKAK